MGNDLAGSLASLGAAVGAVGVLFAVLVSAVLVGARISWVDVAWGLGFPLVAWAGVVTWDDGDRVTGWLLVAMSTLWGLRLVAHTGRRLLRHDGEDPRYDALLARSPSTRTVTVLTRVVAPQGAVMLVVALPLVAGPHNTGRFAPLLVVGVAVWAVGLFFEAVGDRQLEVFKRERTDPQQVLDSGLWRYTRHPNYFGDVCCWWGMGLVACASVPGVVALVGPALMTWAILTKTGSALTERTMRGRPGYAAYVERTSGFWPLPPRRGVS